MQPKKELGMRSLFRATLVLALAVVAAVSVAQAAARTSGRESARGQIITIARNGHRTVVSSIIVLSGVFNGAGKIVEVPNRPGDPGSASRDNLVFPVGTLRIINFTQGQPQISLNPKTCVATVRIKQTSKITGGTARFSHARGTFKNLVRAYAALARNPDGSCNERADALLDSDALSGRGILSL
jgi:hypothetical protein